MSTSPTSHRRPRSRAAGWRALAGLLLAIGTVLVIVGSCGTSSGPPQPSAGAAGTIPPAVAPSTPGSSSSSAVASTTSSPTPASPKPTTAPPSSSSYDTRPTPDTDPPTTGPIPKPHSTISVPSFGSKIVGPVLPKSKPTSINIPALGVSSTMLDLNLMKDGTVETPPLDDPESKAGWYTGSPTPGTVGPSIVLGHVDSKKYGPGIFYDLGNLKPGDTIEVGRADGTTAIFKVDAVRSFEKAEFPTEEIYGNLDYAGLRLITCGGTFDPDKGSYESNIIAFASLVDSRKA
jgi:hypothetical protein